MPWTGLCLANVSSLHFVSTEDVMAEMPRSVDSAKTLHFVTSVRPQPPPGCLNSSVARPDSCALSWTESTSEQVSVVSWLRTEGEMTKMADNPWVRESPSFQRLEPSHATVYMQASDQSARDPRLVDCLDLN